MDEQIDSSTGKTQKEVEEEKRSSRIGRDIE
jgi:hypothetical protein